MSEAKFVMPKLKFERMESSVEMAALKKVPLAEHEGYFRDNNGDWIISSKEGRIASVSFQGKAKRGETYCAPDPIGKARAEYIVAAVNSHDALRDALKALAKHAHIMNNRQHEGFSIEQSWKGLYQLCLDADAALKAAETEGQK